jgi:hypothetical protein
MRLNERGFYVFGSRPKDRPRVRVGAKYWFGVMMIRAATADYVVLEKGVNERSIEVLTYGMYVPVLRSL